MAEVHNNRAGGSMRFVLANPEKPQEELALVQVPDGASFVLRPRFLVALVHPADQRVVIRRRWQFFRWQSWVRFQFRFFEFVGPCRLTVAATPGFRTEWLSDREGNSPVRRMPDGATVGFTPDLDCKPARSESFWNYFRGRHGLFDDLFSGDGRLLILKSSSPVKSLHRKSLWRRTRANAGRILGM
jgi:hypothetical protein